MKKNYPLNETPVFNDFREMVENAAAKDPNKIAFSYKRSPLDEHVEKKTFSEVRYDVRHLGTAIHMRGLSEKKVAIIGEASYGWIISYFALMASGAVTVPADKDMPADELADMLDKADCEAVFYSAAISEKIAVFKEKCPKVKLYVSISLSCEKAAEDDAMIWSLIDEGTAAYSKKNRSYYRYQIDPDKLASIVFTSGTTGKGKGVMLSQSNIVFDITQGMKLIEITDKTMLVLPPHHTFGSTVNIVGHFAQNSEIYISSGIKYFKRELKEQQPSHLVLVPLFVETLYKTLLSTAEKTGQTNKLRNLISVSNGLRKAGVDMRSSLFKSLTQALGGKLKFIICGGAVLNQDIIDFFGAVGITVLNGYGITECSPLISCNRNKLQKSDSVGMPIPGEKVRIARPNENGEGEICVKGPNVMLGYYNDPAATAAAFDRYGYFKTGDFGKVDSDGWLYITGRLKNLIIFKNGKNIYPEEIEDTISQIPGVNEVIVYAGESKSNPEKEGLVAEIFPDFAALNDRGISDIKSYFAEEVKKANLRMVAYKAIGSIKLRATEFPKNVSHKIKRFDIDKTIE